MEMLLNMSINNSNWSNEERNAIIDRAVEIYLEKRRKTKTSSDLVNEESTTKRAKISNESLDSESGENDFDSDGMPISTDSDST